MRAVIPRVPDLQNVRHELREVFVVGQRFKNLLHRGIYIDRFLNVDRATARTYPHNSPYRLVGGSTQEQGGAGAGGQ